MKKIYCFGETLIDFLQTGSQPSDGISLPVYCQFPGGAPANAAVAVAKLGGEAAFVGQVGEDTFGNFLEEALSRYGVETSYLFRHPTAHTALAFVTLDDNGERSFCFYRQGTADVLFDTSQISEGMFESDGILHLCSNTLTDPYILGSTEKIIDTAVEAGLWVSMDVNLRHSLWKEGRADVSTVRRIAARAHVVKFSLEEIQCLSEDVSAYIEELLSGNARVVLVTNGGDPVAFYTHLYSGELACPQVQVVDTTCGGDAFIGGLLYQLSKVEDLERALDDKEFMRKSIVFATQCGAYTVSRMGAFTAMPEKKDIEQLAID